MKYASRSLVIESSIEIGEGTYGVSALFPLIGSYSTHGTATLMFFRIVNAIQDNPNRFVYMPRVNGIKVCIVSESIYDFNREMDDHWEISP